MKTVYLFSIVLSVLLLCSCGPNKSKDPFAGLNAEQTELAKKKQLSKWPGNGDKIQQPGDTTIFLTDGECLRLGGKVEYHPWCGVIRLKCVVGDRAVCIDELDPIDRIPTDQIPQ